MPPILFDQSTYLADKASTTTQAEPLLLSPDWRERERERVIVSDKVWEMDQHKTYTYMNKHNIFTLIVHTGG